MNYSIRPIGKNQGAAAIEAEALHAHKIGKAWAEENIESLQKRFVEGNFQSDNARANFYCSVVQAILIEARQHMCLEAGRAILQVLPMAVEHAEKMRRGEKLAVEPTASPDEFPMEWPDDPQARAEQALGMAGVLIEDIFPEVHRLMKPIPEDVLPIAWAMIFGHMAGAMGADLGHEGALAVIGTVQEQAAKAAADPVSKTVVH